MILIIIIPVSIGVIVLRPESACVFGQRGVAILHSSERNIPEAVREFEYAPGTNQFFKQIICTK